MNSRLPVTLLCAGAVALACGSLAKSDVVPASVRHADSAIASAKAKQSSASVNSKFAVNVEPHALHFALNVQNTGKKNVELAFPSGQQVEFSVQDSVGREVYRWGSGRMFTQSVQNRLLDGGDTMTFDERAAAKLPKGRYIAVATLRSTNFPVTARAQFEMR